jgi:hypothetical protein
MMESAREPTYDALYLVINAAIATDENAPPDQENMPSTRPRSGSADSVLSDISNTAAESAVTPALVTPMKRKKRRHAWNMSEKLYTGLVERQCGDESGGDG